MSNIIHSLTRLKKAPSKGPFVSSYNNMDFYDCNHESLYPGLLNEYRANGWNPFYAETRFKSQRLPVVDTALKAFSDSTGSLTELPRPFVWYEENFLGLRTHESSGSSSYSVRETPWTIIQPVLESGELIKGSESRFEKAYGKGHKGRREGDGRLTIRHVIRHLTWPLLDRAQLHQKYYWVATRALSDTCYQPHICLDLDFSGKVRKNQKRCSPKVTAFLNDLDDLLKLHASVYAFSSASAKADSRHVYIFLDEDICSTMKLPELKTAMYEILRPLLIKYTGHDGFSTIEFRPDTNAAMILPMGLNSHLYTRRSDGKWKVYKKNGTNGSKAEPNPFDSLEYLSTTGVRRLTKLSIEMLRRDASNHQIALPPKQLASRNSEVTDVSVKQKQPDDKKRSLPTQPSRSESNRVYDHDALQKLSFTNSDYSNSTFIFLVKQFVPNAIMLAKKSGEVCWDTVRHSSEKWLSNHKKELKSLRGIDTWLSGGGPLEDIINYFERTYDPEKVSYNMNLPMTKAIAEYLFLMITEGNHVHAYDKKTLLRTFQISLCLLHYCNPAIHREKVYRAEYLGKIDAPDQTQKHGYRATIYAKNIESWHKEIVGIRNGRYCKYLNILKSLNLLSVNDKGNSFTHAGNVFTLYLPFDISGTTGFILSSSTPTKWIKYWVSNNLLRDAFGNDLYQDHFLCRGEKRKEAVRKSKQRSIDKATDKALPNYSEERIDRSWGK
ncbi:MAG: hypothetical protein HQK66_12095 [Desulfamplus sp.]|nr:hypothetical protein [Desulfamplus sp.]